MRQLDNHTTAVLPTLGRPFRLVRWKIWPLREKFGPLEIFTYFEYICAIETKQSKSLYVGRVLYFLDLHRIGKNKGRKAIFQKFDPFCTKTARIHRQILSGRSTFYLGFLSYAAEQSAV